MAHPFHFEGANKVLGAPSGQEDRCTSLPVFSNGNCCVSCWQLSSEEIAEVARTGKIYLSVWFGQTQPPVLIGGEEEVRSVVIDYGGVWKK